MTLQVALARTLLLMRDEVGLDIPDETLISALAGTRVLLLADEKNIATHSAQTAFITAAMLMARSAHEVVLAAPNVEMAGAQHPLEIGPMIERLMEIGGDLLPDVSFGTKIAGRFDLAVAIGDTAIPAQADRCFRLNADDWTGRIQPASDMKPWEAGEWPFGAMAAAAMATAEAFKISMHKLGTYALNPARMSTVFAPVEKCAFELAPKGTPCHSSIRQFDLVSGGAITNGLLYALLRIPGLSGFGRLIEPDTADLTNMNRYVLLRRSHIGNGKAQDLAALCGNALPLLPLKIYFENETIAELGTLAPAVLVGVDDIPTRWIVQGAQPSWLGIGATTHWSAMASFHSHDLGCARCLHRYDDPGNALIPTVAFVSFWAGLLTATYFLRHVSGSDASVRQQQTYLTPFRPENPTRSQVPVLGDCPICHAPKKVSQPPDGRHIIQAAKGRRPHGQKDALRLRSCLRRPCRGAIDN